MKNPYEIPVKMHTLKMQNVNYSLMRRVRWFDLCPSRRASEPGMSPSAKPHQVERRGMATELTECLALATLSIASTGYRVLQHKLCYAVFLILSRYSVTENAIL